MASKHAAVLVSGAPDLIVLLIFRGIGKLQLRQKYHLDIGRLSVNNTIDAALELKEFEYISPESPRGRYIYLATDGLFFSSKMFSHHQQRSCFVDWDAKTDHGPSYTHHPDFPKRKTHNARRAQPRRKARRSCVHCQRIHKTCGTSVQADLHLLPYMSLGRLLTRYGRK